MFDNPYKILGLEKGASNDDVKKAYKRLAMKYHPDRNQNNPSAEEKFKEIKSAYDQIIKPKPDFFQQNQKNSDWNDIFRTGFNHDIFSDFIKEHMHRTITTLKAGVAISLKNAVLGGTQYISFNLNGKPQTLEIKTPPNLKNGQKIKYPNLLDGKDVIIQFQIKEDKDWKIDGNNLIKKEKISIWDLILGMDLDVTLLDETKVRIKIPEKTQPGTFMKVKNKGLGDIGDLYVQLIGIIPETIPNDLIESIKSFK